MVWRLIRGRSPSKDDVKMGEDILFFISIYNLGENDISGAKARVEIIDPGGEIIKTLESEPKPISSKQSGELIIRQSSSGMLPGDYSIKATVFYDNKEMELKSSFRIDEFLISLISLGVDDYTLGSVAKFTIVVNNIGNRLVEDFYSRILLNDKGGKIAASLNSFKIDIGQGETKETTAYWDTKDIDIGEYYGKVSLEYEDEMLEKEITTTVMEESIEVEINEITGMAVNEEMPTDAAGGKPLGINVQLSIIIVLLVVIAVILFLKKPGRPKKDY